MSQRLVPHAGASRVELPKPGIYMAGECAYRPVGTRAWSSENQFSSDVSSLRTLSLSEAIAFLD